MAFLKRMCFYLMIALLLWSIKDDLTNKQLQSQQELQPSEITMTANERKQAYEVVKVKVNKGETVLTIIEKLNKAPLRVSTEQMLTDFRTANPRADPYHLQPGMFYYFPMYE
ncbi:hypothetical protein P5G51_009230 [Virgibacillus sp. 179-BFC.A HS]|uniref:LysM domain-containing protein n=1 Tax=Tigheibacillus jepli TaxID=3035914 RepID=A0ABU5CGU3_9BACI|nr:hypothetical protein [Virgibacillus sp. 179-BFC.A HS]MDY0405557.1 hypothetical protein [Virgibacillus sp. 179-BFC.A HS]